VQFSLSQRTQITESTRFTASASLNIFNLPDNFALTCLVTSRKRKMKLCHCFQNTREIQLQLTNAIYLRNKNTWLKSMDLNQGWTPAGKLPLGFGNWSADENWKDVHSSLPGKHISPNAVPKTFVSLEPAVFIELKGEPVLAPVAGTSLIWVSNTERDLLHSNATGAFCYLLPHESDSIRCAFDFESVLLRRTTHTEELGLRRSRLWSIGRRRRLRQRTTHARGRTRAGAPSMDHTNF